MTRTLAYLGSLRSRLDHMDVFAGKIEIREYLAALNKDSKVS